MGNLVRIGGGGIIGGGAGIAATMAAFTLSRAGSFRDKAAQAAAVGVGAYVARGVG